MYRNRRHRLITVIVALTSLLFMQLALAGYVCPGVGSATAEVVAMAKAGMPCAESMQLSLDDQQPSLCHAHCQTVHQSSDKYELPSPVTLNALPVGFGLTLAVPDYSEVPLQAPHLQHSTAPPLTIRNCCLRL